MFTRIMELGFGEIVVIAAIVLLLFGPQKLPRLGEALGRGIRNFRDAASGAAEAAADVATPEPEAEALPAARPAAEASAALPGPARAASGDDAAAR